MEAFQSAIQQSCNQHCFYNTDFLRCQSPCSSPAGNIGELAVYGTVNDLAMRGARPLFLSAGFILEEGLPMETLGNIVTLPWPGPAARLA